jgi:hypothetical protein
MRYSLYTERYAEDTIDQASTKKRRIALPYITRKWKVAGYPRCHEKLGYQGKHERQPKAASKLCCLLKNRLIAPIEVFGSTVSKRFEHSSSSCH